LACVSGNLSQAIYCVANRTQTFSLLGCLRFYLIRLTELLKILYWVTVFKVLFINILCLPVGLPRKNKQKQLSQISDSITNNRFDFVELFILIIFNIHTYHSRFIPERVAETSQKFLSDVHVLPKLFSYE
jgi:hypothetical protein